jgi:phytoene dehydrogenase-like protein
MRFHAESKRSEYDAIVIGGGVGGLTAGALLARAGRSVLLVERHDRVGGYAHSFRRGPYVFDSAVHMVGGCEPVPFAGGGMIHELLSELGVRDRCQFERIDPCYAAVYPGLTVTAPGDLEEFERLYAEEFPAERKGLREFLQECLDIRQETQRAAELGGPYEVMRRPERFPALLRYRRATLGEALDAGIESPRLKAALATLWPYLGLPPSRVSFLYFATMLMSYLADRAYYCRGSFQRFADALALALDRNGGEVLLRSSVRRIRVEDGRVRGVVLENGQRIDAPVVISNADATQTVLELVGEAAFPRRFVTSLRRMKPSLSAFVRDLLLLLLGPRQRLADELRRGTVLVLDDGPHPGGSRPGARGRAPAHPDHTRPLPDGGRMAGRQGPNDGARRRHGGAPCRRAARSDPTARDRHASNHGALHPQQGRRHLRLGAVSLPGRSRAPVPPPARRGSAPGRPLDAARWRDLWRRHLGNPVGTRGAGSQRRNHSLTGSELGLPLS